MNDSPYQALAPKPLWSAVVDQIREHIESGRIPEGSRLPSERQLCAELGVSRVSLREAFRVLQASGYIETRAGAGTFARLPDPQAANWVEDDIHVVELLEVRIVVEPGAAALAAKRRTRDALASMQAEVVALRNAGAAGDFDAAMLADQRFHQLVGDSVSNPSLTQLMHQMQDACGAERNASLHVPGQIERAVQGHQLILDAIAEGDPEKASEAMRVHLQDALAFLTDHTNALHLTGQIHRHERRTS